MIFSFALASQGIKNIQHILDNQPKTMKPMEGDIVKCTNTLENADEGWSFLKDKIYKVIYCHEKTFILESEEGIEVNIVYWQADDNFTLLNR